MSRRVVTYQPTLGTTSSGLPWVWGPFSRWGTSDIGFRRLLPGELEYHRECPAPELGPSYRLEAIGPGFGNALLWPGDEPPTEGW